MTQTFEKRLNALADTDSRLLCGGLKGVEKESLRVTADGKLARTPHPPALGSALTNRYITTDFSEALLEFVTPAFRSTWETLRTVCDIHQYTYEALEDELLWASSMPCLIPDDSGIPLARYGQSNVGRMKTVYRRGLGYRYGRQMQTIAGVHFNYSVPAAFWQPYRQILGSDTSANDFQSAQYLGMIRNFRRAGWLLLYLFGASPALCRSFVAADEDRLQVLHGNTWYSPYATSLRMSDIGYSNQNQARIRISLNSVDGYIRDMAKAVNTAEPSYEEIGVKVDGEYRQLNANLLQIENEYYAPVRPKRVARSGERPTAALRRGGIEYVEIRSLDTSFFDPCGISQNTMRFVETLLLYCLLQDSALLDANDLAEAAANQGLTARQGRDPGLRLMRRGQPVRLRDWAREVTDGCMAVAELLDHSEAGDSYAKAVAEMQARVDDAETTPSAIIVRELEESGRSFFELALEVSQNHKAYFSSLASIDDEVRQTLDNEAVASLQRQQDIEAADRISFDEYLNDYFSTD